MLSHAPGLLPALLATLFLLSGCAGIADGPRSLVAVTAAPAARAESAAASVRPLPAVIERPPAAQLSPGASLSLTSPPASTGQARPGASPLTLAFEDAPLHDIVHSLLHDGLARDYVLETPLTGRASLRSSAAIAPQHLLEVLAQLLASQGLRLSLSPQGVVHIGQPANAQPARLQHEVLAVPLQYLDTAQALTLLDAFRGTEGQAWAIASANILLLTGTRTQLASWQAVLASFDIDLLAGMSVGLIPLQRAPAEEVEQAIAALLGSDTTASATPSAPVRLLPLPQHNSLLVLTPRRHMLAEVAAWAERLDLALDEHPQRQLFLYPLQHADADDLLALLTGLQDEALAARSRVVADVVGKRLVIHADYHDFLQLRPILARLDKRAPQVMIDVDIVEVALNDDFQHGLAWAFRHGLGSGREALGRFPGPLDPGAAPGPGFSWQLLNSRGELRALLNLIAQRTGVELLSRAAVLVSNGENAVLHAGDEIATETGRTSTSRNQQGGDGDGGGDGNPMQGTELVAVEYRDTGIKLEVTPSISSSGRIHLDFAQSITELGPPTSAIEGLTSYVFSERKLTSSASALSGQTLILGGLIKDHLLRQRSEVPLLARLPGFSPLFSHHGHQSHRTELLLLLTPRLVSDDADARALLEELRPRLQLLLQ